MKKKITLLVLSSIFIASLASGCSQETDQELEDMINNLPAIQGDPFDSNKPSNNEEGNISYISVSGKVVALSKDSFTVKLEEQEQKFYINDSTNIFGGKIAQDQYVTVTYNEADKSEKKIYVFAVTVLNGETIVSTSEETTVSKTTDDITTTVTVIPQTTDEVIAAETTDIITTPVETEASVITS